MQTDQPKDRRSQKERERERYKKLYPDGGNTARKNLKQREARDGWCVRCKRDRLVFWLKKKGNEVSLIQQHAAIISPTK